MEEWRVDDAGGSVDKQQDEDGGQGGFDYDMKQLLQRPALFLSKVSCLLLGNILPERVLNGTEKEKMGVVLFLVRKENYIIVANENMTQRWSTWRARRCSCWSRSH